MNKVISIFDYEPPKRKSRTGYSSRCIDRTKTHCVFYNGNIISWHIDFYNAQTAVERHLNNGKIHNGYEILTQQQLDCKHNNIKNGYCIDCLRDLESMTKVKF